MAKSQNGVKNMASVSTAKHTFYCCFKTIDGNLETVGNPVIFEPPPQGM